MRSPATSGTVVLRPPLILCLFDPGRLFKLSRTTCQRKVEMSPSVQNRNVPFAALHLRARVNLPVPVKRRRAMVATNPIKG